MPGPAIRATFRTLGCLSREQDYAPLTVFLTAERIASHFEGTLRGKVERYEMRNIGGLNFMIPVIPGTPLPDNLINPQPDYDLAPAFRFGDLSGAISRQPPLIRGTIPLLVPKTDKDGNETGGLPSPLHQAPLGTYLGSAGT